jgi:stage V sporulation protein R
MYFAESERNMVNLAAERAIRVDEYIGRYGLDKVERIMDVGFAIDRHIDFHKGTARALYPPRAVVEEEVKTGEYADLFGDKQFALKMVVVGDTLPPHPEKDLLWFLANYAPIESWEKDVLETIWKEAHYFYPQFETKILNEGWATYWHAEVLYQYAGLTPAETIDFGVLHAAVVNPGHRMNINPYYLGYRILVDVERRWDEMYKKGESKITGRQKLFEIRSQENDISFLQNYLTQDLADDMEMFAYGYACEHGAIPADGKKKCQKCGEVEIKSRNVEEVVNFLLMSRYNYGAPKIFVENVTSDGTLVLLHEPGELGTLDVKYAQETMKYLYEIWKKQVNLKTVNPSGYAITLFYRSSGFSDDQGDT